MFVFKNIEEHLYKTASLVEYRYLSASINIID